MRIFGISIHIIVALFFAVHAVRTHQNMYWLLILFLFPGLGSVVYFFAIYLPELRQSRGARAATRAITQLVDPNRAVREARSDFDRAPTVAHRMRLGAALLAAGEPAEALQHYQAAANGPFATDPALLQGLAQAQFATGDAPAALATLEKLFAANPHARRLRAGADQRQRRRAALPVRRLAGGATRCRRPRTRAPALRRHRPRRPPLAAPRPRPQPRLAAARAGGAGQVNPRSFPSPPSPRRGRRTPFSTT